MFEPRHVRPDLDQTAVIAYVALGSNLGDRLDALERARRAIAQLPAVELLASSHVHESPAETLGPPQPDYLNAVLEVRTYLDALNFWRELAAIETQLGRIRPTKTAKAPRVIDIDLIAHGDARLMSHELCLPHPRWSGRGFVVYPLTDLGVRSLAGISLHTLLEQGVQPTRVTHLEWTPIGSHP